MKRLPTTLLLIGSCTLAPPSAAAHEVRPGYLEMRQLAEDTYDVLFKVPARGDWRLSLDVRFPAHCDSTDAPWLMAAAFGLLHGLGFAGALSEVGLPEGDIPLALLFFNVGVEAGQLLFIAAALLALAVVRRLPIAVPRLAGPVPAYAIGALAMFWVIERVVGFV